MHFRVSLIYLNKKRHQHSYISQSSVKKQSNCVWHINNEFGTGIGMLIKEWKSDKGSKSECVRSPKTTCICADAIWELWRGSKTEGWGLVAEGCDQKLSECQTPANNNGPCFPSTSWISCESLSVKEHLEEASFQHSTRRIVAMWQKKLTQKKWAQFISTEQSSI